MSLKKKKKSLRLRPGDILRAKNPNFLGFLDFKYLYSNKFKCINSNYPKIETFNTDYNEWFENYTIDSSERINKKINKDLQKLINEQ